VSPNHDAVSLQLPALSSRDMLRLFPLGELHRDADHGGQLQGAAGLQLGRSLAQRHLVGVGLGEQLGGTSAPCLAAVTRMISARLSAPASVSVAGFVMLDHQRLALRGAEIFQKSERFKRRRRPHFLGKTLIAAVTNLAGSVTAITRDGQDMVYRPCPGCPACPG
jgi:hypothetical protein